MGQHIAKIKRTARKPQAALFNVDKVLERKTPAPRHPTTVKAYDELVKANPQFKVSAETKNDELHKRLESVRVESEGVAPDRILRSSKKLEHVREGRLSYDEIEELFINRKVSPELWDEAKVAENYKLDIQVSQNLLQYFSSFHIYKKIDVMIPSDSDYLPDQRDQPKKLPGMVEKDIYEKDKDKVKLIK